MRRFAMLVLAGFMLAALVLVPPAHAEISITPGDVIGFISLQGLVPPSTFTLDEAEQPHWKYDNYQFTGDLPPAVYYVAEFFPSGVSPTYYAVFWDDQCGALTKHGACIRVRIRTGRVRTLDELKPYLKGTHLKNRGMAFIEHTDTSYDIYILKGNRI